MEKFSQYKKALKEERQKLLKGLEKMEKPEDFGDDVDDFDEEKNEAESFSNKVQMAVAIKGRLSDIAGALQKISSGAYGVCEKCGKQIEEEILLVSPESRLCRSCKKAKS